MTSLPPAKFATLATPTTVQTALAAFLRGIERRGAVLAELQSGDAASGDAALAAAMRALRSGASTQPMSQWPQRFWSLLLATPQLRRRTVAAVGEEMALLSRLDPGPRAALLLRLAAGLSEADAAAILAVPRPAYRQTLQRALPRHHDGRADPGAWLRLREHVHRRIKTLPVERLAQLARLREAALAEPTATARARAAKSSRPRWLLPLLWILLAVCAAGLAATFARPQLTALWQRQHDPERIGREALPAEPPAARFDAHTALLSHRDFELLADPQGAAAARELAFFSWLAAQPDSGVVETGAVEAGDAD